MKKKNTKKKDNGRVIQITYLVNSSSLDKAIKKANELRRILKGIHFA